MCALSLLQQYFVAKRTPRRCFGVGARHALMKTALGELMEMSLNLLIEFVILPFLCEETPGSCSPHSQQSHRLTLPFQAKYAPNYARDALPVFSFEIELLFAKAGDRVKTCLAFVLRSAPFGIDPTLLLEPNKGGVNGTFIQLQ